MEHSGIEEIAVKHGAELLFGESMAKYTTFRIGGECDALIKPNSAECLRELLLYCRENGVKSRLLGRGSNVLVSDKGLRGLVIVLSEAFSRVTREENRLICEAGAALNKVCAEARDASLTGMEFAYGIPGTVGGALYMNAGAYGGEIKDIAEYCDYLDEQFNERRMYADEMELSYRHSVFTEKNYTILRVCFKLENGEREEISEKMNTLMSKRRASQPLEYPSAGSTFKRPAGDYTARLIEASGLKGFSRGGAMVSEKHSGFVINTGGATCEDVLGVVDGVKKKVFEDSGIMLECEMLILE